MPAKNIYIIIKMVVVVFKAENEVFSKIKTVEFISMDAQGAKITRMIS
jgi:hypothetical protein